jgi:hypothetical protein
MYCIYYSENTFVSSIDFRTWEIDQDKFNIHYKVLIKQNVFLDQFSLSTAMLYYIDDKWFADHVIYLKLLKFTLPK